MHIHILGIGGTFMSGLALLAKEAGYKVTGNDQNCYPPISNLLKEHGINWIKGYESSTEAKAADHVIIGNVIKRGMPILEEIINYRKDYISGPQWVAENILAKYKVIAIAGTHGKTTISSMVAYILTEAGLQPGFLIGGINPYFNRNAYLGKGEWFVIEADEYDSAFFDKRPKFMHYRPKIAVLNNLEFDHADIYPNLDAIEQQFHYFLKTLPKDSVILKPADDEALNRVFARGVYSTSENFSLALGEQALWHAQKLDDAGSSFNVYFKNQIVGQVNWQLLGDFNIANGLAAIIAAAHAGVIIEHATKILNKFTPVKKRLEVKFKPNDIVIYDDFAHHPTAIAKTIQALNQSKRHERIFVVLELASFTMRAGIHNSCLPQALQQTAGVFILESSAANLMIAKQSSSNKFVVLASIADIVANLVTIVKPKDAILIMSNRDLGNIYEMLNQEILKRCQK